MSAYLRSGAFIVAFLLLAAGCVAAQTRSIDTRVAREYFQKLKETSDRDDGRTWGRPMYGPVFFVDPSTPEIVANQPDKENKLTPHDEVFAGTLPGEISPSNTAIDWAGVHWTMVMWPVPELRQPRERLLL